MDRRLIGALLVVAVLTVAIVVPASQGLRMAGVAEMIELPVDPRVGDCVLEPLAEVAGARPDASARGPYRSSLTVTLDATGSMSPLDPMFGRCDGQPVAGEVVAVVSATGDDQARVQQAQARLDCRRSALEYAGLVPADGRFVVPGQSPVDRVRWKFSINVRSSWVLPSPFLRAAGRSWVACVVTPASGSTYRGHLARAYSDGTLPDEFGLCWDKREPSASISSVACSKPHLAELLSVGTVADSGTAVIAGVQNSCQQLAARVLRRSDPTAAGGLVVGLSPKGIELSPFQQPLDVLCYVAPARHFLAGTLVGVGDRPIPYSG